MKFAVSELKCISAAVRSLSAQEGTALSAMLHRRQSDFCKIIDKVGMDPRCVRAHRFSTLFCALACGYAERVSGYRLSRYLRDSIQEVAGLMARGEEAQIGRRACGYRERIVRHVLTNHDFDEDDTAWLCTTIAAFLFLVELDLDAKHEDGPLNNFMHQTRKKGASRYRDSPGRAGYDHVGDDGVEERIDDQQDNGAASSRIVAGRHAVVSLGLDAWPDTGPYEGGSLTPQERRRYAHDLRAGGKTWAEVGRALGVSPERARQLVERHRADLQVRARPMNAVEDWLEAHQRASPRTRKALAASGFGNNLAALAARGAPRLFKLSNVGEVTVRAVAEALEALGLVEDVERWVALGKKRANSLRGPDAYRQWR